MLTFFVEHNKNIFYTPEEFSEEKARILKTFNLPIPHGLKVTLSKAGLQKIKYFHSLMKEHRFSKLEFYIHDNDQDKENNFYPMFYEIPFDSNEYIDFGDVFFKTFCTKSIRIELDSFHENITFFFLYSNGWTEEVFDFSYSIKKLLSL